MILTPGVIILVKHAVLAKHITQSMCGDPETGKMSASRTRNTLDAGYAMHEGAEVISKFITVVQVDTLRQ